MEKCLTICELTFVVVALIVSLLYGWFGPTIIGSDGKRKTYDAEKRFHKESEYMSAFWLHQIWVNFAGSAIGFAAGYYLIFCRGKIENLGDDFLLLVAMAGIFGYLPWVLSKSSLR